MGKDRCAKRMARFPGQLHLLKSHSWLPASEITEECPLAHIQKIEQKRNFLSYKLFQAIKQNQSAEEVGRQSVWIPETHHRNIRINRLNKILLRLRMYKVIQHKQINIIRLTFDVVYIETLDKNGRELWA